MHTETKPTKPTQEKPPAGTVQQQQLARAMQVCCDVARLYKKHGGPPTWVKLNAEYDPKDEASQKWLADPDCGSTPFNHAWKRAIRLSAWRTRPVKRAPRMRCATCGGWFVGPTSSRCQCPTAKPARTIEEEE